MNFFTRQHYLALQERGDEAMDAADAVWEEAVQRYDAYLQSIRPEMPASVRQLVDGFFLLDACMLSMGRSGDPFVISLQPPGCHFVTPPNSQVGGVNKCQVVPYGTTWHLLTARWREASKKWRCGGVTIWQR